MSLSGPPIVILPGKRPPPPVPPDVAEIVRVLNGAPPRVCPACGRPWRPPEPRVIYDAEIPRPQPMPRPRVGKSTVSVLRTQDFTPPE